MLTRVARSLAWMDDAQCRGEPGEWWLNAHYYHRGVRICDTCPVMNECGEWGKYMGETGLWGGVALIEGEAVPFPRFGRRKRER